MKKNTVKIIGLILSVICMATSVNAADVLSPAELKEQIKQAHKEKNESLEEEICSLDLSDVVQ